MYFTGFMKKKTDIITKIAKHFNLEPSQVYGPLGISRQRYHYLAKHAESMKFEWTPRVVQKLANEAGIPFGELNSFLSRHYFG